MNRIILSIATLVTVLVIVAPASAAPALSIERAERAANREAQSILTDDVNDYQTYMDACANDPEFNCDPNDEDATERTVSFELDECERVSASRALCSVVFQTAAIGECESEIGVRTTKRNRVVAVINDYDCEAEDL